MFYFDKTQPLGHKNDNPGRIQCISSKCNLISIDCNITWKYNL